MDAYAAADGHGTRHLFFCGGLMDMECFWPFCLSGSLPGRSRLRAAVPQAHERKLYVWQTGFGYRHAL